jgi:hypothetical protein
VDFSRRKPETPQAPEKFEVAMARIPFGELAGHPLHHANNLTFEARVFALDYSFRYL